MTPAAGNWQGDQPVPSRRYQRAERRPAPKPAATGRATGDLTPLPDLLHGRARAGPVRRERPVYVDLLPPCNNACPAGENIQGWLAHLNAGEDEQAWRLLVSDNPFPAIHGRVCYHPCETSCNRAVADHRLQSLHRPRI
jgi:dihydroprymidine dehydrogenase-like protein